MPCIQSSFKIVFFAVWKRTRIRIQTAKISGVFHCCLPYHKKKWRSRFIMLNNSHTSTKSFLFTIVVDHGKLHLIDSKGFSALAMS
jgi:hypothetical protein